MCRRGATRSRDFQSRCSALNAVAPTPNNRPHHRLLLQQQQQQQQAKGFVIATGVQASVREFVQRAAAELGITVAFSGDSAQEIGTVAAVSGDKAKCQVGDVIVRVDPRYFRPTEVETLLGDPSKVKLSFDDHE